MKAFWYATFWLECGQVAISQLQLGSNKYSPFLASKSSAALFLILDNLSVSGWVKKVLVGYMVKWGGKHHPHCQSICLLSGALIKPLEVTIWKINLLRHRNMFIIERLEYPKLVLLTSCVTTDLNKHLQILNQKSTKILSYRKNSCEKCKVN